MGEVSPLWNYRLLYEFQNGRGSKCDSRKTPMSEALVSGSASKAEVLCSSVQSCKHSFPGTLGSESCSPLLPAQMPGRGQGWCQRAETQGLYDSCFSSLSSHPPDPLISQSCSVLLGPSLPYYFLTWIVVALSALDWGLLGNISVCFLKQRKPLFSISPTHRTHRGIGIHFLKHYRYLRQGRFPCGEK